MVNALCQSPAPARKFLDETGGDPQRQFMKPKRSEWGRLVPNEESSRPWSRATRTSPLRHECSDTQRSRDGSSPAVSSEDGVCRPQTASSLVLLGWHAWRFNPRRTDCHPARTPPRNREPQNTCLRRCFGRHAPKTRNDRKACFRSSPSFGGPSSARPWLETMTVTSQVLVEPVPPGFVTVGQINSDQAAAAGHFVPEPIRAGS